MKSNIINHWIAPQDLRLPDFIICGAMKCGTTTVHEILNSHPAIGIPNAEINFFDIDDTLEHSDFLFHAEGRWFFPDISENNRAYWKWYSRFFSEIPDVCLIGEDSTCYLASSIAPFTNLFTDKTHKDHYLFETSHETSLFSILAHVDNRPCTFQFRRYNSVYPTLCSEPEYVF